MSNITPLPNTWVGWAYSSCSFLTTNWQITCSRRGREKMFLYRRVKTEQKTRVSVFKFPRTLSWLGHVTRTIKCGRCQIPHYHGNMRSPRVSSDTVFVPLWFNTSLRSLSTPALFVPRMRFVKETRWSDFVVLLLWYTATTQLWRRSFVLWNVTHCEKLKACCPL